MTLKSPMARQSSCVPEIGVNAWFEWHVDCFYCQCRKARPIQNQLFREGGFMGKDLESRGVENEVKGAAKEMKGNLRGDLGDATDNTSEHIKGRAEQLEGKIQKNFGKSERKVDENT